MVGTIFCLWTFTRLHCGNRGHSNCSLFCGSYFGSQKRMDYAVISMLFFLHISCHEYNNAFCALCILLFYLFCSSNSHCFPELRHHQTCDCLPQAIENGYVDKFPSDSKRNTLYSHIWTGQRANKNLLSNHEVPCSVSGPFWGTAS